MVDLSTRYLGLDLSSPIVPSASPLSEEVDNILRMEEAGAAAVVLHSLFEEQLSHETFELHHHMTYGTESFAESLSFFPEPENFHVGPELYLEHINQAKIRTEIPIIASLNCKSGGRWIDFAKKVEDAGADALELNIYNIPTDIWQSGAEIENNYVEIVKSVKNSVNIPVAVKLSPFFTNMGNVAQKLDETGVDGLVLFNRFYQPDINLLKLELEPRIFLSESNEIRLPLTWIGILYEKINADLAATSGVHSASDIVKLLMAGASVTMTCAALLKHGIKHLSVLKEDLKNWMEENEYESVYQMQGSMSQVKSGNPQSFERAQYMRTLQSYHI